MNDWIKTGNSFADSHYMSMFMGDPIMLALVDYLEAKGVLNKTEFAAFVNEHCQAIVSIQEKLAHEPE